MHASVPYRLAAVDRELCQHSQLSRPFCCQACGSHKGFKPHRCSGRCTVCSTDAIGLQPVRLCNQFSSEHSHAGVQQKLCSLSSELLGE